MRIVRFLMIAEIPVPSADCDDVIDRAQARLDEFRESARPSQEYGITLYRAAGRSLSADMIAGGAEISADEAGDPNQAGVEPRHDHAAVLDEGNDYLNDTPLGQQLADGYDIEPNGGPCSD